jgi:hypothetical protein
MYARSSGLGNSRYTIADVKLKRSAGMNNQYNLLSILPVFVSDLMYMRKIGKTERLAKVYNGSNTV